MWSTLMPRKKLYPDYRAGEKVTIRFKQEDFNMACCDCNLVHKLRFTVKGNTLIMQVWRDNRATAQLRRRRGVPIREG